MNVDSGDSSLSSPHIQSFEPLLLDTIRMEHPKETRMLVFPTGEVALCVSLTYCGETSRDLHSPYPASAIIERLDTSLHQQWNFFLSAAVASQRLLH